MSVIVGRSRIATKYGIVAASQPLAARAGVQILERGGNAVDAAIADQRGDGPGRAAVERHRRRPVRDRLRGQDRRAPRAQRLRLGAGRADAGAAARRRASRAMPQGGIHTVTVPGAVAGWEALRAKLGSLPLVRPARAGDLLRRRGLPGLRRHRRALGGARRQAGRRAERRGRPICRTAARRAPARCSAIPTSRDSLRRIAERGRGRLLRRRDRRRDPRDLARERRHDDRRRSRASSSPNGSSRSRRPIAAGPSTSCRRTRRASPR